MSFFISYAGNREDVLIKAFFPDVEKGFYVDIGANHPVEDSVTKIFYDAGWSGINVEPLQSFITLLDEARPRDSNECVGIAETEAELTFREYGGAGRSTFSTELMAQLEQDTEEPDVQEFKEYPVKTMRLETLLNQHQVQHIHFMKIDVEGLEYDVIKSNDWNRYRPELLCIEGNHVVRNWQSLLTAARYELVFFDGLNEYYLAEESLSRKQYFDYPKSMLSGSQIIKWTVDREFNEILTQQKKDLEAVAQEHQAVAEKALKQADAQAEELRKDIKYLQSGRGSLATFFQALKRKFGL